MEGRTGLYICSGCDIGKSLNLAQLGEKFKAELEPDCLELHPALCSPSGTEGILAGIRTKGLDKVVLAACSPRFKTDCFNFGDAVLVERVNIREQVAWTMEAGSEDSMMAASDYIRMGLQKLQHIKLPEPFILPEISREILVVGAGIAGITAALEGARAGYRIHLLEKEMNPGGFAARLFRQIPFSPPFKTPVVPIVHELAEELGKNKSISLHCPAVIEKISGQPGDFRVEWSREGQKQEPIHVGAIVSAMGFQPYDPNRLGSLGYGKFPQVVTSVEMEEIMKENTSGKIPGRILFIQCAGSRDKDHLPYCSNVCCGTSLKQARYIREKNPDSNVYIIYKDIRTTGMYENFYRECQKDDRLFLTAGEIGSIEEKGGSLQVEILKSLLGGDFSLEVDMIVLATGMTPAGSEDLNLAYRQGKGLPVLKYNFPDSHFICFPYETRRTGIYVAGTQRMPMDIPSTMEDAGGAMMKAIQCIESAAQGKAVHPRSGETSRPVLYLDRCTDCKRCTEECPFGSYDENEKGTPILNPNRCRTCGICLGSCPERVISFSDYSVNSVSAMIKAVEIPDEFEEKPRILAFICENDAYPAFDMAASKRLKYSPYVRIIPVRCLGSVNKVWILDALSKGFDGILQIGCKPGDDYQCHFIHGSELTDKRGENIQESLETMMLEPERIKTTFVEITDYDKIPAIIDDYVEEIEGIGPNPFKGM